MLLYPKQSSSFEIFFHIAFQIPYILWAIVRNHANTEIQMNAIERAQHYSKLPNENREGKLDNEERSNIDFPINIEILI